MMKNRIAKRRKYGDLVNGLNWKLYSMSRFNSDSRISVRIRSNQVDPTITGNSWRNVKALVSILCPVQAAIRS